MQNSTAPNTAIIPVSKLEEDGYDWWQRHRDVLEIQRRLNPEVVLIGDSITHFWGGAPQSELVNGSQAWQATFGARPVLNLGFGWDRTQNVLWRLDNGQFEKISPQTVVVNIGGNNFAGTVNARANTPAEVAAAVLSICARINAKAPKARIIVMGVFPRRQLPDDPGRAPIVALNELLASQFAVQSEVTFLDIGSQLLERDGTISSDVMGDFCHPAEKGYAIWGNALKQAGI